MQPKAHEGQTKAWYVPAIADEAAPTVAEIAAGVPLSDSFTADGIQPNHTENTVSTEMLSGFIKQSIGTEGVTFNLRFLRDFDGTDDVWDTFDTRGKVGYLVISNDGGDGSAADVVEVYPAEFGRRKRIATGANSHQAFTVLVTVTDDYDDDAVVAA